MRGCYAPVGNSLTMLPLMLTKLLKAKLHRAIVTETRLDYHGSITIDSDLLKASGLLANEGVLVADCENGNRFETYIIPGKAGTGVIGINGAAARLSDVGHHVIVMSFVQVSEDELPFHKSRVLILDDKNHVAEVVEHKTLP